jgi:hypothetical protein
VLFYLQSVLYQKQQILVHTVIVIDIIIYYSVYTQELSNGMEFTSYEGWNVVHYMYIKILLKFALLQKDKYPIALSDFSIPWI